MRLKAYEVIAELARAVAVLALVFLSFGHQPVVAANTEGLYLLPDGSLPIVCGQLPAGADRSKRGASNTCAVHQIGAGLAEPAPILFAFSPHAVFVPQQAVSRPSTPLRTPDLGALGPRAPPFA